MSINKQYLILGDWGTSTLRLMLYVAENGHYTQVEIREGTGAKDCEDFPQHFHQLADSWYQQYGDMPALLAGMVGANIGWKDAGYIKCPVSLAQLAEGPTNFSSHTRKITIMPGVRCENRLGNPDIMRGEEMQIFGWLASQAHNAQAQNGPQLLCLPGTHTKWALTDDNTILDFLTIPSGELYDLISRYGIYVDGNNGATDMSYFNKTIKAIKTAPEKNLQNMLFSTRSKSVLGAMTEAQASSYLSALIIGFDVRSAVNLYAGELTKQTTIPIIGSPLNANLYAQALACFGFKIQIMPGDLATSNGLLSTLKR